MLVGAHTGIDHNKRVSADEVASMSLNLLAISDIHGDVEATKALVVAEVSRTYDAVIVAGDIARTEARQIFDTLEEFRCPILYVYGNWDCFQKYEEKFSDHTFHLHDANYVLGDLLVCGFSGCQTSWGLNPIWKEMDLSVAAEHTEVLAKWSERQQIDLQRRREIEDLYQNKLDCLEARARDRRKRGYRERRSNLEQARDRLIEKECDSASIIERSRDYERYRKAREAARKSCEIANRKVMVQRIKEQEWDVRRVIAVSHERLFKFADDMPGLGLHLYGHLHKFEKNEYKGTLSVNVASLDDAYCGQYVIIDWEGGTGFRIESRRLPEDPRRGRSFMRHF